SIAHLIADSGKRSVTIDLDTARGQEDLRTLARTADVVYESTPRRWLAERGFGWEELSALNPALSLISVTPFGRTGPLRDTTAGRASERARGTRGWSRGATSPARTGR